MKPISVVILAVFCVCMAAAASASAHLFHASKTGLLLGLSTNVQIFTPSPGGALIECKHALTHGEVTQLLGLHQLVTVTYAKCSFLSSPVTITPAKYLLSADGLVAIKNNFVLTSALAGCSIKFGPQNLGTVKYDSESNGTILELSEVTGIVSTGSGGLCGTNNTGGMFTGDNLLTLDGGSFGWL